MAKPVVKQGRKATDLIHKMAGLQLQRSMLKPASFDPIVP